MRPSKDPKVYSVSIEKFLEDSGCLADAEGNLWNAAKRPSPYGYYYHLTPDKLILIGYDGKSTDFGRSVTESLMYLEVALRDGVAEYELLNSHLRELRSQKRSPKTDERIEKITSAMRLLPQYAKPPLPAPVRFEDCLFETGYKTPFSSFRDRYVVFDVETNGLRKAVDDLLSLSIYDPTTGVCYHRRFPLDMQPLILTGWIHGITDEQLLGVPHWSQTEIDKLIEFFHLKERILLSYSGGKGTFDRSFLLNYCKRHQLYGFERLKYENIKSMLPQAGTLLRGQGTKDNLCKLLGIDGVREIHSSENDCLLEWKLFEAVRQKKLFFLGKKLYQFHEGYIVPVSYLNANPELAAMAGIKIPEIIAACTERFRYSFPKEIVSLIKKFPTNITGIALENGINAAVRAERQDNFDFLAQNKRYIQYIGELNSGLHEIPVEPQRDGTLKSLDHDYDDDIAEVNMVTQAVVAHSASVFEYIRSEIFGNEKILSQELCISKDGKVLALCDLSSQTKVLEIKTMPIALDKDHHTASSLARQLYYESRGREVYLLSIDIRGHFDGKAGCVTDAVDVIIYGVSLKAAETS